MKSPFLPLLLVCALALLIGRTLPGQGVHIEKPSNSDQAPEAAKPNAPSTPKPTPDPQTRAAEALYDYLQKHNIEVAKDQTGGKTVWTDRALIEITDGPPPEPLSTLLSSAPTNDGAFATWVHNTFETQTKAWHPGRKNPHPAKQGTDEIVGDAANGGHCYINPVYLSYVLARYPTANILIKGPTDPALFVVQGQLRAVISPWTQLPDGTPLL